METNPVFSNNITNMYNENSRGPRTDPCGTPYFTGLRHDVGRSAKHRPNVYAIKEGGAIILAVVLLLPRRVLQTLCFVVKEKRLCLGSKRGQTRNQWLSKIYSTVPEHFNTNIRVCAAQFTQVCPEAGRVAYNASVLKDCFYKAEQFQLCKLLTHSLVSMFLLLTTQMWVLSRVESCLFGVSPITNADMVMFTRHDAMCKKTV